MSEPEATRPIPPQGGSGTAGQPKFDDLFLIHYLVNNKESEKAAQEAEKRLMAHGVRTCLVGNHSAPKNAVDHVVLTLAGRNGVTGTGG